MSRLRDTPRPCSVARHCFVYVLLAAVLSVMGDVAAVAAAPVQQDTTQLATLINESRAVYGLSAYQLNGKLAQAAQIQAQAMAAAQYVSHTDSNNGRPEDRAVTVGYSGHVTEIVFGGMGDAQRAFAWWRDSDVHGSLILSTRYTQMGIGAAVGEDGWTYWAVVFGDGDSSVEAAVVEPAAQLQAAVVEPAQAVAAPPPPPTPTLAPIIPTATTTASVLPTETAVPATLLPTEPAAVAAVDVTIEPTVPFSADSGQTASPSTTGLEPARDAELSSANTAVNNQRARQLILWFTAALALLALPFILSKWSDIF
ncbi:MAG: CAP domain-containing protein [Anaerolineales bacterium]|nr:CAP domain-containing protein [Anaerolineales bacterium]